MVVMPGQVPWILVPQARNARAISSFRDPPEVVVMVMSSFGDAFASVGAYTISRHPGPVWSEVSVQPPFQVGGASICSLSCAIAPAASRPAARPKVQRFIMQPEFTE